MNYLKKYGHITLIWSSAIMIYLLILTMLNYFQVIKFNNIIKINFIAIAIITFIIGIMTGRTSTKKGYIEGLKIGSLIVLLLFFLNLIFLRSFNLHIFIYYLTIIISSTFGSMVGINLKKK